MISYCRPPTYAGRSSALPHFVQDGLRDHSDGLSAMLTFCRGHRLLVTEFRELYTADALSMKQLMTTNNAAYVTHV